LEQNLGVVEMVLDHQGRKSYKFEELAEAYGELKRLTNVIEKTRFVASAALLHSEDIHWAYDHAFGEHAYYKKSLRWYEPLYKEKVTVDVLDPHRDLSKYKVVFAPNIYIINSEIAENLKSYVRNGGFLIVGPKTALKNWNNVFFTDIPPCLGLSEVFGTTVKRFFPSTRARIRVLEEAPFAGGMSFVNEGLAESLEPTTAKTIAIYENGDAAVTLNEYGEGSAMYLGCEPEEGFYRSLIKWLISIEKLEPVLKTDADVEVTMRVGGGYKLIFILNHNQEPAEIMLEKEYHELISDKLVSGILVIEGRGVRILSEKY